MEEVAAFAIQCVGGETEGHAGGFGATVLDSASGVEGRVFDVAGGELVTLEVEEAVFD